MLETTQKLEISQKEIDLIASALETQSKILGIKAGAGDHAANTRLNDVKRAIANISAQREAITSRKGSLFGLSGLLRMIGQTT